MQLKFKHPVLTLFLLLLLLLWATAVPGQEPTIQLPQSADISVAKIYLLNSDSTENILGKELGLERNSVFPSVAYLNEGRSESFTLIFHPGSYQNSFSEFMIKQLTQPPAVELPVLTDVQHFVTGKGIKLGMARAELSEILGQPTIARRGDKEVVLTYIIDNFHDSIFLQHYNMPVYVGVYTFKQNQLVTIRFGFEYP